MKHDAVAVLVCLLVLCTAPGEGKKKKQELKTITEYKPDDCSVFADTGDTVTVHYNGKLQATGQVFDSSRMEGREPFTVTLGAGQVIKGWDEGLVGMCIGETRRLIIPPHLAYGDRGVEGAIPAGATLEFEVELMDMKKKPYLSMPQGNGFLTAMGILGVLVIVVYELYKRANKQGEDLRESKKKDKETKRGKSKRKKE